MLGASTQFTVDDFAFGQFVVYTKNDNYAVKMTAENCKTEAWEADYEKDNPSSIFVRIIEFFKTYNEWLKMFFDFIKVQLSEKK